MRNVVRAIEREVVLSQTELIKPIALRLFRIYRLHPIRKRVRIRLEILIRRYLSYKKYKWHDQSYQPCNNNSQKEEIIPSIVVAQ